MYRVGVGVLGGPNPDDITDQEYAETNLNINEKL
jgi:hypothetical protein